MHDSQYSNKSLRFYTITTVMAKGKWKRESEEGVQVSQEEAAEHQP